MVIERVSRDRVYGMLFGAAIGDALGAPFEFVDSVTIEQYLGDPVVRDYRDAVRGSLLYPRRAGASTDDTAMTLALVQALTAVEALTPQLIFETFARELRRESGRYAAMFWQGGPGGACVAMLRLADRGGVPFAGLDPSAGGNGAAMRAHPCGAFAGRDAVAQLAAMQARLSHPHPAAIASAQVVALIVNEALETGALPHQLPAEITEPTMVAAWERAHANLRRGDRLPHHLCDVDMAGWNTVAAAHAIAQLYEDDIETAIGIAAASGRDTDTIASIVGGMLGAVHGYDRLPARWIVGLQARADVEAAADALYRRVMR